MSDNQSSLQRPVVAFSHVCKDYTLYASVGDKLKGLFLKNSRVKTFRAVDDVSFTMRQGEVVGLIGLNGSGKSTIASMITGITKPSEGKIRVKGEVNMLSASSGMRPMLSGIDNIRFKCLLLGFTNKEIAKLEKEIIDFADIGIYINQPINTYSSGMVSRLGFAISVHMNPDILIIDEALSVGDNSFADKCLNKINEFKERGKTIVFVSHSTNQMEKFCDRVIWINRGAMVGEGLPHDIVVPYCGFAREFAAMTNDERATIQPNLEEYQKKYLRR